MVDQGAALGLASDQRGLPRPIDFASVANPAVPGADGSDIGAVEVQPVATFSLGKLQRNRKKGTALLTVVLPTLNLGTLTLTGKGPKPRTRTVTGATEVTFAVATNGKRGRPCSSATSARSGSR